jgi:bifunctional DNA-binding transcriptional regulator/antitoxin component of YhaV-PrlF toxin-antitoxin module
MHGGVERSLGFIAVQSRGGTITIPAEARRALRLDVPGAQVEVILRDNDLLLIPHVAVPLEQIRGSAGSPDGSAQAT